MVDDIVGNHIGPRALRRGSRSKKHSTISHAGGQQQRQEKNNENDNKKETENDDNDNDNKSNDNDGGEGTPVKEESGHRGWWTDVR